MRRTGCDSGHSVEQHVLISLTKGPNRKFITVSEDDILDLPNGRASWPRSQS